MNKPKTVKNNSTKPQDEIGKRAWSVFKASWLRYQTTKHPNVPAYCLPSFKAKGFGDGSANAITNSIAEYITISGGFANRQQSQGQYDPTLKRFRHGTVKRGSSDLICLVNGKSLHIEIKFGRDKQSEDQKIYQKQIEDSGGLYFIATSFPQFYEWFTKLFPTTNN